MTANYHKLFINDINSIIIKMDGNSLANASVIIYKIYRFREAERRAGEKNPQDLQDLARLRAGKIINKIYKISLACEQEKKETNSIYSHNSRAE